MFFLTKILNLFKRTKVVVSDTRNKIKTFISEHKNEIKVLMKTLQFLYNRGNGATKMQNVVRTVCSAIGIEEQTENITNLIQEECQKIYDELVLSEELGKQ